MKISRFEQLNEKNKINPVGDYIWKEYLANISGIPYFLDKISEWESTPADNYSNHWYYFSDIHFRKSMRDGDPDSLSRLDFEIFLKISKEIEEFGGEFKIKQGKYGTGSFLIDIVFKNEDKLGEFVPYTANKYNL